MTHIQITHTQRTCRIGTQSPQGVNTDRSDLQKKHKANDNDRAHRKAHKVMDDTHRDHTQKEHTHKQHVSEQKTQQDRTEQNRTEHDRTIGKTTQQHRTHMFVCMGVVIAICA